MSNAARKKDEGGTVVPIRVDGPVLDVHTDQEWWTPAQQAALDSIGLTGCPDADKMAFLHLCQSTGLDPFRREIYLIGRKDRDAPSGKRWTAQTGIDGFRHIAERTGVSGGRVGPQWCGPDGEWRDVWLGDGPPAAARVGYIRTDRTDPLTGGPSVTWATCLYREYEPRVEEWEGSSGNRRPKKDADGNVITKPGGLWGKMPANQIAKCAEAAAVRATFPRAATGVYEQAEMDQADAALTNRQAVERREELRSELASKPWRTDGDPEPPTVVDGEVVAVPERDALWTELEAQARVMGQTVTRWTQRWVKANRKNADEADAVELWDLVRSRRQMVEDKAEADGVPAPAHAEAEVPDRTGDELVLLEGAPEPAPDDLQDDEDGPAAVDEGQGTLLPDGEPQGRHLFVGDGDRCEAEGCGRYLDDEEVHGAP